VALLAEAEAFPAAPCQRPRLRNGAIQTAVAEVLRAASNPMSTREVQVAAERVLGQAVSKDTVNSCLSVGCRGKHSTFERVETGVYRLRSLERGIGPST
jgi:hypothetical protein